MRGVAVGGVGTLHVGHHPFSHMPVVVGSRQKNLFPKAVQQCGLNTKIVRLSSGAAFFGPVLPHQARLQTHQDHLNRLRRRSALSVYNLKPVPLLWINIPVRLFQIKSRLSCPSKFVVISKYRKVFPGFSTEQKNP